MARTTAGPSRSVPSIALLAILWALLGCSTYQEFDSAQHLQGQLDRRLSPDLQARVEIPFELSPEVTAAVQERLSPAGSEKRRTEEILDFIFGWLHLEYSLTPTRDADGTFVSREGNCLSFVNLFVGVGRLQRLNPFYVEVRDHQRWNYRDGVVVSRGHIVAGLNIDGELSTFDFLPYRPKSYRDFRPIDDLAAMAHYYNNLGAEALMAGDLDGAERHLELATALAPDFQKATNNLGVVHLRRGRPERAAELYAEALEREPADVALLTNLARAYQDLGRDEDAAELLARLEDVNQGNPFFYVYRGQFALGRGELDEALEYMRRALRIDSEVPEVHLGLAEVYLALGEVPKARHHVERALKLDATHADARRYAAMLDARGAAAENPGGSGR